MIESNYLRMLFEEEDKFVLSTTWMERKFNAFNEMYFNGKLPTPTFKLNNKKSSHGLCRTVRNFITGDLSFTIFLSKYYNKTTEHEMENVLVHEMIHEANFVFKGFEYIIREGKKAKIKGHGESFLSEMERINSMGKHKVMITGVSNDKCELNDSEDMRDFTEDLKKYKFIILSDGYCFMGLNVTPKTLSYVIQHLTTWNIFVCNNHEPMLFRKFPKFFRRNQRILALDLLKRNVPIESLLNTKKLEVEDVYIRDNCKLMYKPSIFTMEYLKNPQSYIESGDNMNGENGVKDEVNESVSRKKRKYLDDLDIEGMNKVFDNVEIDGDEIIVDIE